MKVGDNVELMICLGSSSQFNIPYRKFALLCENRVGVIVDIRRHAFGYGYCVCCKAVSDNFYFPAIALRKIGG